MEETIYWGQGTSDKITIRYSGTIGDSVMVVTSDPNRSYRERTQKITIINDNGEPLGLLTIIQQARSRSYSISYEESYK